MRIYTEEKSIIKQANNNQHHYQTHHNNNNNHNHHQNGGSLRVSLNDISGKASSLTSSSLSPTLSCSSSTLSIGSSQTNIASIQNESTFELHHNNGCTINRLNIPLVFNKNRPNISMYKFISTKGKQATRNGASSGFNHQYFHNDDNNYLYKPPQYINKNHNFYKKRISAIDKIQEELREMKLREDELRCQRVRDHLSSPNLNSICDEDFNSDDQTIESSEENKDSFHSRCSSNPDLLSGCIRDTLTIDIDNSINTIASEDSECGLKIGGPRRKIPLIAIWEQKIQEKNGNENNGIKK